MTASTFSVLSAWNRSKEVLEIATPAVRQLLLICKPSSHCRGAFSTLSVTFSDRSSLVCWQSYSFTFPIWTVPLLVHLFTFNCAVGKEWWNKRWCEIWSYPCFRFQFLILFRGSRPHARNHYFKCTSLWAQFLSTDMLDIVMITLTLL